MNRLHKAIATSATVLGLLAANLFGMAPMALADGTGQIEGGPDVYLVKDLTSGGAYGDNITAAACDELQYSIRLHNSGFTAVNNINLKAALSSAATTSNTSTVTATYTDGIVPSTSDTTKVNFATAQSISYESGTTQLFDGSGHLVGAQPDGIVGSGISLGSLNGSTTEFVNFKAKVNCPPQPAYTCDALGITSADDRTVKISAFKATAVKDVTFTNAVITWGDNSAALTAVNPVGQSHQYGADGTYTITATAHFALIANGQDLTATGPQCTQQVTFASNKPTVVTPPTPVAPVPTTLVNTGPGSIAGLFAATSAVGTFAHRWMLGRRLSRQ